MSSASIEADPERTTTRVAAVDLGATSGRVAIVDLETLTTRIVKRFLNAPIVGGGGHLRWDWPRILAEVESGLELARAQGPLASIGVDTWGVDYGLGDARGDLVALPHSYWDRRTDHWRAVVERVGVEYIYRTTGIQMMKLNTLCQLAVHDREELARAKKLLMLPELLLCHLTGTCIGERTSAGTTQLVDIRTGEWSEDLAVAIGIDPSILPPILVAGRPVGFWRGIPVTLVAGHDTASAVAALPDPAPGAVFVSLGTWALVGTERPHPDTSEAARLANFSNEPCAFQGVRFLKNVVGLAPLERCRDQWGMKSAGDLQGLLEAAAAVPAGGPIVDLADPILSDGAKLEAAVRKAGGLPDSAGRDRVARCILDSIAVGIARVIGELGEFMDLTPPTVQLIGGGSRNRLLNSLIQARSGVRVEAGPAEATCLGNALLQGIALGFFEDLASARKAMRLSSLST